LDVKKRFTEEQIIGFLREVEAGMPVKEMCRKHGFSEASYYLWRSKFGGMSVPDAKRLKELETENGRLKKLLAEQVLENEVIKDALRKSGERTGATRAGAADGRQGVERAALVGGRGHERQRVSLCHATGSER
jgi:putative transposase